MNIHHYNRHVYLTMRIVFLHGCLSAWLSAISSLITVVSDIFIIQCFSGLPIWLILSSVKLFHQPPRIFYENMFSILTGSMYIFIATTVTSCFYMIVSGCIFRMIDD